MPLPKALRRPVRRASSTGTVPRRKCRLCNNLDPRGHVNSVQDAESLREPRSSLSLILDALALSTVKAASNGGCRFCVVLAQALDAYCEGWRGIRCKIEVDIKEKGTIKVRLNGAQWAKQAVEIYAGSGRRATLTKTFNLDCCYHDYLYQ